MILNDLIALSTRYMSSFYLDHCRRIRSFRFGISEVSYFRSFLLRSFRFCVTSRHSTLSRGERVEEEGVVVCVIAEGIAEG